jgi:hypothetical protein
MFMDARRGVGAAAGADRHDPFLRVGEESVPFLVGRCPVFLAGSGGTSAGDERPVRFDGFGGVDGFYSPSWCRCSCARR